jgi:metal-responsive CopG/Arc/MetJ family transcriptional regulator
MGEARAVSRGTTHRTVRIEDGLWEEAKAAAAERGENLSDVLRDALRAYVESSASMRPATSSNS